MEEITTLQFTDNDSGSNCMIVIRAAQKSIALCISLEENGDIEVFFGTEQCQKLIEALSQAKSVAASQ